MPRVLHFAILITNHHIGATTFTTHRVFLACIREDMNNFYLCRQSWTNVLTHLSKANAFYRRPSVISNNIFFVDSQPRLSPFSMLQYAPLHGHFHVDLPQVDLINFRVDEGLFRKSNFHAVATLKRGEGIEMSKLEIEKLTRLTKQVFFGERLNCFCPCLLL